MSKRYVKEDIDRFFENDIFVPERTLYMGSVEYEDGYEFGAMNLITERIVKGLLLLEAKSKDPITIVMNNPGGDWYHGMAVYDAIKSAGSHITIKAYGHAMSMGSIVFQAADERLMAPSAVMLLHYGIAGSGYVHTKDFIKRADEEKRLNKIMEDIYLNKIREKHKDFTREQLQDMINFDKFLSASQAVAWGLADGIIGE